MSCVFFISKLDQGDLFDYMWNWTSIQVEQNNDHLGQNDQWLIINLNI
jgi:hypothetical protein